MKNLFLATVMAVLIVSSGTGNAQGQKKDIPLLVQESSWKYDSFRSVGTLAYPDEICRVFDHAIFIHSSADFGELDSVNFDFKWDGIEAAPLWIAKKFKDAGVSLDRLSLRRDILALANQSLSLCIRARTAKDPNFYDVLKRHFLHYLDEKCFEDEYRVDRAVDDAGNLTEKRVVTRKGRCIDFGYNSGRYSDWNSTTLSLMLVWREAHPVLLKIFDQGQQLLVARIAESKEKQAQETRAEAERKRRMQEKRDAENLVWRTYAERQKTILEQVYNFASTGNPNGERYRKWTEVEKCVMSDGSSRIDNRKINMTAFRISREFIGSYWYMISSDRKMRLSTSANIPMDRLQNAWGLAFRECPGITSRF